MQDNGVVNAFLRFSRDFAPHDRVVGGDTWDMRPLRTKANTEEKRDSIIADFDAGYSFLESWRPTAILQGNHCARLWEHAKVKNGPVSDLARAMTTKVEDLATKLKSPLLPYHKSKGVHSLGSLNVVHGFYAGEGAARKHASVYGPVMFGHIHASDHVVLPDFRGHREAWSSPALCLLDLDYNHTTPSTMRYDSGWLYGEYSERDYHVEVARVVNGQVKVAKGFESIKVA
jgi:hypothetical protein